MTPSPDHDDPPELAMYWELVKVNPFLPDPQFVLRDGITLEWGHGQFPVLTLRLMVEWP